MTQPVLRDEPGLAHPAGADHGDEPPCGDPGGEVVDLVVAADERRAGSGDVVTLGGLGLERQVGADDRGMGGEVQLDRVVEVLHPVPADALQLDVGAPRRERGDLGRHDDLGAVRRAGEPPRLVEGERDVPAPSG